MFGLLLENLKGTLQNDSSEDSAVDKESLCEQLDKLSNDVMDIMKVKVYSRT